MFENSGALINSTRWLLEARQQRVSNFNSLTDLINQTFEVFAATHS